MASGRCIESDQDELWAGAEGHPPGSVDRLRSMQAAGLNHIMEPAGPQNSMIYEADIRGIVSCADHEIASIVGEVARSAGRVPLSNGNEVDDIVRQVIETLKKRSLRIPGYNGDDVLLPSGRFEGGVVGYREERPEWFDSSIPGPQNQAVVQPAERRRSPTLHDVTEREIQRRRLQSRPYTDRNLKVSDKQHAKELGKSHAFKGNEVFRRKTAPQNMNSCRSSRGRLSPTGSLCSGESDSLASDSDGMHRRRVIVNGKSTSKARVRSRSEGSLEGSDHDVAAGFPSQDKIGPVERKGEAPKRKKKVGSEKSEGITRKVKRKKVESDEEMRVTNTGEPIGAFWLKMRHYAYSYAPRYFPWHLKWCEQDKRMKNSFIRKLEDKFGGGWNDTPVLKKISKLLRNKRLYARSLIREEGANAHKPLLCTLESWDALIAQEDMKETDNTFARASKAFKARKEKGSFHHLGTCGIMGTYAKFFRRFGRQMEPEEMAIAKAEGYTVLMKKLVSKARETPSTTVVNVEGTSESPLDGVDKQLETPVLSSGGFHGLESNWNETEVGDSDDLC